MFTLEFNITAYNIFEIWFFIYGHWSVHLDLTNALIAPDQEYIQNTSVSEYMRVAWVNKFFVVLIIG